MLSRITLSKSVKEKLSRLFLGIIMSIFMLGLYVGQPYLLQQADRLIYDIFLRWNAGGEPSPTPALIDLDEKSLEEFGQWPWPRHLVAKLIANLTEKGAAAIGLDILLSEPDNSSAKNLQKSFKQHFNLTIPLDSIPKSLQDNDLILSSIISQAPVVLGGYARFTGEQTPLPKDLPHADGIIDRYNPENPKPRSLLMQAKGATLPLPELRAVAPIGILNIAPDADGIIRSAPLVVQIEDRILISLSLRSLMRGLGKNNITLVGGKDGLEAIRLDKYNIPVSPDGRFIVPFRGPRNYYPTFRAADILNNKIPMEELQGRVFIVGTSAPGLLDIRATPFDSIYPGAEVHTTVIDAILSDRNFYNPSWVPGAQVLCILIIGIISSFIFSMTAPIVYLPLLVIMVSSTVWGSWQIFLNSMFISPLYVVITIVALALTLLALRFWQEAKQKRTLRNAFSRYIAPDMVKRIVEKGEVVLAGEERQVTLMFTDIRGFTSISEKLNPVQVVEVLNQYFTPMTSIIRGNDGTVDKFIGDAIMAFWNAPLDVEHHELKAVNSSIKMLRALEELNAGFEEEIGISLRMGIGLHSGKVYVGNMGSEEMLDYTCIGDSVNLASRLEGLCPVYGVKTVVSAETAKSCQDFELQNPHLADTVPNFMPLDIIKVKGKNEAVEICVPLAKDREAEFLIDDFTSARAFYLSGEFTKAKNAFMELCQKQANTILYELYLERSKELEINPPEDWQGIWTFTKK